MLCILITKQKRKKEKKTSQPLTGLETTTVDLWVWRGPRELSWVLAAVVPVPQRHSEAGEAACRPESPPWLGTLCTVLQFLLTLRSFPPPGIFHSSIITQAN